VTPSTRGYLTLATGPRAYLEMAVDMTLSLRDHTTRPVALVADEPNAAVARDQYGSVFDHVTILPPEFRVQRARKYGVGEASPFEETAYVDADCLVLGSLEHAWDALSAHDLAFVGELLTTEDDENHHGFSTRKLMRTFGLDRYLKTNSGFFCFRTAPARVVMREILACYMDEARPTLRRQVLLGRWLGDEIAIGIVGGRRRLGALPKPAEMYWPDEFPSIDPDRPSKPLLHMIWPLPDDVLRRLCHEARGRRKAAGVPDAGVDHWMSEQRRLARMAGRRRWLERLRLWKR
jgi:hypothetical protein